MSVAYVSTPSIAIGTDSLSMSMSTTLVVGNALVLCVAHKYSGQTVATPTGWTAPSNNTQIGGAGVSGVDTGVTRATAFYRIVTGTETNPFAVSISGANACIAQIFQFSKTDASATWGFTLCGAADSTGGEATISLSCTTNLSLCAGDQLLFFFANNNNTFTFTSHSFSMSVTWGTITERGDNNTGTGDDMGFLAVSTSISSGGPTSVGALYTGVGSGSASDAPAGAGMFIRLFENTATSATESTSLVFASVDNQISASEGAVIVGGTGLMDIDSIRLIKDTSFYSVTATTTTSGSFQFSAPTMAQVFSNHIPFGALRLLALNGGSIAGTLTVSLVPTVDWQYHPVTTLASATSTGNIYLNLSVSVSDQFVYAHFTESYSWSVNITSGGFWSVEAAGSKLTDRFKFVVWDATNENYGTTGTIVVTAMPIPTGVTVSSSQSIASIQYGTDVPEGTAFFVITRSAVQPTDTQIRTGLDNDGSTAAWSAFYPITDISTSFNVTTLCNGVTYYVHGFQRNFGSQTSTIVTSSAFVFGNPTFVSGGPHNIWQWLYQQQAPGGIQRRIKDYLNTLGFRGGVNTMLFNWLRGEGYTGSLPQMISQFERANTDRYGDPNE